MGNGVGTCGRRRGVLECSKWIVPRMVDVSRDRGESDVFVMVAREPQREDKKETWKVDLLGVRTGVMSSGDLV